MGSNSGTAYWMDIFYIDLLKKLYCLFVEKRPEIAQFSKNNKKKLGNNDHVKISNSSIDTDIIRLNKNSKNND